MTLVVGSSECNTSNRFGAISMFVCVVPVTFWLFSIGGGSLLLIYSLYRKDPVYIAGQAAGLLIYFRNLEFLWREHRGRRKAATAAE